MPIDCNAFCNNDSQRKINLIGKNNSEEIQDEVIAHRMCIIDCERRNNDAARHDDDPPLPTHRSSGGNRKKYIGKTKSSRSRTRRRIHRSRTNHRKKTTRR